MTSEETTGVRAAANTSVTAAGAGDNTVVTGDIFDRDSMYWPREVGVFITWTATLAASKNLFLKNVVIEHGDASNLSDVATLSTLENGTGTAIATDSGSGSTLKGCKKYNVHLGAAKRYIRLKFTPDLDATSVDTAALAALLMFASVYKHPAV